MSRFKEIDSRLEEFANKLGATLTKDRPSYPESLRTFEERRIDWIDLGISKAIIIQPSFESSGVNSMVWYFTNIAWFDDGTSIHRLKWMRNLIEKKEFEIIESNIDDLLIKSELSLTSIKIEELK